MMAGMNVVACSVEELIYERLRRQRLVSPLQIGNARTCAEAVCSEYLELFRTLQPVSPNFYTRPGDPPTLMHRTSVHDGQLASVLRKQHRIIKGRFMGGRVGYVYVDDFETYARAFRKPIKKSKPVYEAIMNAVRHAGGISKDLLKEQLDFPNKEISAALSKLQAAFWLYEEQTDTDWDTGWFDFETEWFALEENVERTEAARAVVIERFIASMFFGTIQHIKDWSGFPLTTIKAITNRLIEEGRLVPVQIHHGDSDDQRLSGFMVPGALLDVKAHMDDYHPSYRQAGGDTVWMLDKSDMLVRAHMSELKQRYAGHEVLHYLLINGTFQGAVTGHWRIGPYDIDDIIVDLDEGAAQRRKDEIIAAVRQHYAKERTAILRYNGQPL